MSLKDFFKDISEKDFKEIMSFVCIGTGFAYIFMVTFLPLFITFPKESIEFAHICLGFFFGTVFNKIFTNYFESKKTKDL